MEKIKQDTVREPKDAKLTVCRPKSDSNTAFQFKVQLAEISKPPVWRRLVVADNTTFEDFHNILQEAFGWENYHLYNFSPTGWGSQPEIAVPHEEDEEPVTDATSTELKDIFGAVGNKFT
ncbi:MAG: plasmid pRiA4b ORF-3 family protein [Lentimicrobium sp.]|nr:plasmid pRiA4b ORF-3 family protein [Lentimicrobium sp.]